MFSVFCSRRLFFLFSFLGSLYPHSSTNIMWDKVCKWTWENRLACGSSIFRMGVFGFFASPFPSCQTTVRMNVVPHIRTPTASNFVGTSRAESRTRIQGIPSGTVFFCRHLTYSTRLEYKLSRSAVIAAPGRCMYIYVRISSFFSRFGLLGFRGPPPCPRVVRGSLKASYPRLEK